MNTFATIWIINNCTLFHKITSTNYIIHNNITHRNYLLDFYDKTKNLVIEFQGDYWHCNPKKYSEDFFNDVKQLYAKDIWNYDQNKKDFICKKLNNPIYLQIWESEYKENPLKIIQDILLYYNIKLENNEDEISD